LQFRAIIIASRYTYERDQLRAASNQGPRSRQASEWRWIEYGASLMLRRIVHP